MQYYYLDKLKGSNKGLISEILFKNSEKNIFCTKICDKEVINKLPFEIPSEIKKFLNSFWGSIDCFEFKTSKDKNNKLTFEKLILYEVKSKKFNPEERWLFQRFKFTENEINVYKLAEKEGIKVKIAKILFYENWKYSIHIEDFDSKRKYHVCNGSKWYQKRQK